MFIRPKLEGIGNLNVSNIQKWSVFVVSAPQQEAFANLYLGNYWPPDIYNTPTNNL